ncbi:hypothetical protein [Natrinema soli]|uniref:Uncharacterized protein n=1 Tax=Natrinema soli TaxID=1930624 RepID=A0ABD5SN74_9EURY|nr:hypothetical protein [Natrinema soli]
MGRTGEQRLIPDRSTDVRWRALGRGEPTVSREPILREVVASGASDGLEDASVFQWMSERTE